MTDTTTPGALAAIIVSWNRLDDLRVAVDSLRGQDYPALRLIVIDNGSTDGSRDYLAALDLPCLTVYTAAANLGAAVARNVGLALARGCDYIAFLDSDAELIDPATLSRSVATLAADPTLAAVSPAIYLDRDCTKLWLLGAYMADDDYLDYDRCLRDSADPHFLSTCVAVWRAAPLYAVDGFDPAYPFGFEDFDIAWRVRGATGLRFAVDPTLRAVHHLSPGGRSRDYDTWEHLLYVETTTHRHRALKLGARAYAAWALRRALTPAGRRRFRDLYGAAPLTRTRRLRLLWGVPLLTLCRLPAWRTARARFAGITAAPLDPARVRAK